MAGMQSWQGAAWTVADDWLPTTNAFFGSAVGRAVEAHVRQRLEQWAVIYPPEPLRMLELTPLSTVRVVILGQDPYHGPGQAEGLAFSVPEGVRIPPSLRNIHKEIARDFGGQPSTTGSLVHWARQGVLLLNTCLTVEDGLPASHARLGWEALTGRILDVVNAKVPACVFMLWGGHAQNMRDRLDEQRHLVLTANHPSPLSALRPPRPFIGCGHFREANQWLRGKNIPEVDWIYRLGETMA